MSTIFSLAVVRGLNWHPVLPHHMISTLAFSGKPERINVIIFNIFKEVKANKLLSGLQIPSKPQLNQDSINKYITYAFFCSSS